MRALTVAVGVCVLAAGAFIVFVPDWTHPPVGGRQLGPPPMSLIQFSRGEMPEPVTQVAPQPIAAAADGGPMATGQYKNVQVLTDVSAAEFMRLQQAITQWVAPKQGCAFCHEGTDYASDAKPAKLAARLMLRMVRHINADWKQHVQPAGVTCFTCHRGQPVPAEVWFPIPPAPIIPFVAKQDNWREASDTVRKFFADDSYYEYLLEDTPISVQSSTALPSHKVAAQIVAKRVYEMMMTMSDGIGVNCGYCHNSRVFQSWEQSTPNRWAGFYGIQLTRDLNRNYMLQLSPLIQQTRELVHETGLPVLPPRETGKQTGNGFVLCATCHYAHPEPLNGANMLQDYPGLSDAAKAGAPHS